jgi:hypothetical protein
MSTPLTIMVYVSLTLITFIFLYWKYSKTYYAKKGYHPCDAPIIIASVLLGFQVVFGYGLIGSISRYSFTMEEVPIENVNVTKNYVSYNVVGSTNVVSLSDAKFVNNKFIVKKKTTYNMYGKKCGFVKYIPEVVE